MCRVLAISIVLIFYAFVCAWGTIINVPGDCPTIQAGIDSSFTGDTVLVQPGTYVENINFNGHNIVLGSLFLTTGDTSYISTTIIDGDSAGSVVTFENGEDSSAAIAGFTLRNGEGWLNGGTPEYLGGGGVRCLNSSSPKLMNNHIINNVARTGGGVYSYYSSPIISANFIAWNTASSNGGGVGADHSVIVIHGNTIIENYAGSDAGGISTGDYSNGSIEKNLIARNSAGWKAGGIAMSAYNNISVIQNTITLNDCLEGGSGIQCIASSLYVVNSIIWINTSQFNQQIYDYGGSEIIVSYSDISDGYAGEGNINSSPIFRDPANNDFHLNSIACGDVSNSPCIDAGDPNICDQSLNCDNGLGQIRSDMGAYGGGINCSDIPTLSEWGMLIMALLLLAAGTVGVVSKKRTATEKA